MFGRWQAVIYLGGAPFLLGKVRASRSEAIGDCSMLILFASMITGVYAPWFSCAERQVA